MTTKSESDFFNVSYNNSVNIIKIHFIFIILNLYAAKVW